MNPNEKPHIPARDEEGVTDQAAAAVEDVAEEFLGVDEGKDPSPDRPATSRG